MATNASADNHVGRYQIRERIGAGGMGTVYRAWDGEIERDVALKWLPGYFSQEKAFVERFRREARTIARLEHPHIVPIYDVGEDEGRPYIIMRLLTGGTLRERIARDDFGLNALITAMEQIASALQSAHARGIVHRDIKPGNILFDEHGSAFLSDFGIAKVLDAATQLTGSGLIGTPAYMSPEQFTGQKIDGRSDEYSLAIVVYEALTGQPPFEGNTAQMMYKHLNVDVPEIDLERHPVPSGFNPVLIRALSKDPEARYASVHEFVNALREVAERDPGAAALAALPLIAIQQRPSPPTVPTEVDSAVPGTIDQLDADYREGLEAMARDDWPVAAAAFGRVLAVNPTYGSAREFYAQAHANLAPTAVTQPSAADRTVIETPAAAVAAAAATAGSETQVPPPAPAMASAAAQPTQGNIPGWVKVAGGLVLLLLLLGGGFFVIRGLGGGGEPPAAVSDGAAAAGRAVFATEATETAAPPTPEPAADTGEAAAVATEPPTDTPVPTATSEPSATPLAAADAQTEPTTAPPTSSEAIPPSVRITVSSANLRAGPGTAYPTAGAVLEGDELTVIATTSDESWYLVELENGQRAWVASSVSEPVDGASFAAVPVAATIPPAPTATRVPPTFTPVPTATNPPPPPPSQGGGGNGGNNGGDNGDSPPPVYTAEPP